MYARLSSGFRSRFVIQDHHSKRRHFDLRLEWPLTDGRTTFRSWAVPKADFPVDKQRLAIAVDDHSEQCAFFEGTYPPGSYGAGDVIIKMCGIYELVKASPSIKFKLFKGEKDFNPDKLEYYGTYSLREMDKGKWLWSESK